MLVAIATASGGCAQIAGFPDRTGSVDDAAGSDTFEGDAPGDGGTDTRAPDVGLDGSDAADAPDVRSDALDGGVDAPLDADATADGGGTFCTGKTALFCDDFEGASLAARWPTVKMPSSGTLRIDPDVFVDPPTPGHSLLADSPNGGDTAYVEGGVAKTLGRTTLSFSFRADALPSEDTTYAAQIRIGECVAALYVIAGNTVVQQICPDGAGGHTNKDSPAVTAILASTSTWSTVELTVDIPAAKVTLRLNGFEVVNDGLSPPWSAGTPAFSVGVILIHATPAHRTFHYDDVIFDGK